MSCSAEGRQQDSTATQTMFQKGVPRQLPAAENDDGISYSTQQFMGYLSRHGQRILSLNPPTEEIKGEQIYGSIPRIIYETQSFHFTGHQQHQHQHQHEQFQPPSNPVGLLPYQSVHGRGYVVAQSLKYQQQNRQIKMNRAFGHARDPSMNKRHDRALNLAHFMSHSPVEEAKPLLGSEKTPGVTTLFSSTHRERSRPNTPQTVQPTLHKTTPIIDLAKVQRSGHRRVRSDGIYMKHSQEGLPPFSPSSRAKCLLPTLSVCKERSHSPNFHVIKPVHRRANSASSIVSISSVLSERSIVSDIRKSSFYKDVTEAGVIRLHLPEDNVRLVMDEHLESGTVYKRITHLDEEERFLEYHIRSDEHFYSDNTQEWVDTYLDMLPGQRCTCKNCSRCIHMEDSLPPMSYILVVDCDLYQRVLGEISDSKQIPCGLFFCGHHEDVQRPSICIAVGIVAIVLCVLFALTYVSGY